MENKKLQDNSENKLLKLFLNNKKIIFLTLICLVIAIMSYNCPFTPDDYNYSNFPWTTNRIKSFTDIFYSQIEIYKLWSGRVLFLGLGQVFLFLGIAIYTICNSIAFTYLIYKIANFFNKKKTIFSVVLAFFLIWIFTPAFAEDFIWIIGSVNYLWPTLVLVLFASMFTKVYILKTMELDFKKFILILVLSFITGCSHEMTFFLAGSFGAMYVIFNFKELLKKDYKLKMIILVFILGGAFLILSPGNFSRASGSAGSGLGYQLIIDNLVEVKWLLLANLTILVLTFISNKNKFKLYLKYCILPIALSLTPMLIISEFPPRAMLAIIVFLIIPIIDYISDFIDNKNSNYIVLEVIAIILVLYGPLKVSIYYLNTINNYNKEVQFSVLYNRYSNNETLVLNDLELPSNIDKKYFMEEFYRPNQFFNGIANVYFCKYYECNKVISKDKENILVEIKLKNYELDDLRLKLGDSIVDNIPLWATIPESQQQEKNSIVFEIPGFFEDTFKIVTDSSIDNIESVTIYNTNYSKIISGEELIDVLN